MIWPLSAARPPVPAVLLGDLSLLRSLARARIPAVVVARSADDPTLKSRFARRRQLLPAAADERATVDALRALGRRLRRSGERRAPLIYGTDDTLDLIQRHRTELRRDFVFLLNDDALTRALLDKRRFQRLAQARGIDVPRTLDGEGTLAAQLARLTPPLLVKPRSKVAWRRLQGGLLPEDAKAHVVADAAALLSSAAFREHADEVVVQEYISGGEQRMYSFHGFADERGELLGCFCGRKIRTYPLTTGESAFIELVDDPAVAAAGRAVVRRLGLRGAFKIDMIHDRRRGRYFTLEVNARFTLWNYLGAVNGVNLPAVAYAYLVHGRRPRPTPCRAQYRWLSLYRDLHAFRQARRRGQLTSTSWLASMARGGPLIHEVFAWRDPLPFVWWLGGALRNRFGRAWRASA